MIDQKEITQNVNIVFRQPDLQKIKDYVSSHITVKDCEVCKRLQEKNRQYRRC